MPTLTLTIHDLKGRPIATRQVAFVRCNRDWIWVEDHADEQQPIGQYNNTTGERLGLLIHGKFTYRLPPHECQPFKPFSKLDYIRRTKPIRPAPVKVERVKKVKPIKYQWRVVLASGRVSVIAATTQEQAIQRATRRSRGKPPQRVLSQVNKTAFRIGKLGT